MSSELYLIRHGESQMNVDNHLIGGRSNETPLTLKGVRQAQLLGQYFLSQGVYPDKVFSSPALRTLQTAHHTLDTLGIPTAVQVADDIQEMDQGSYVGRLRADIYTPDVLAEIDRQGKDFKLPGGESMNDAGARMKNWLDEAIPANSDPERIFVFGHGMAIRSLIATLNDWTRQQTFEATTENTSITRLYRDDIEWQLDYLGATPHLVD